MSMELTLKINGLSRASDASDILAAVNDKIDTLWYNRAEELPPHVEFHYQTEVEPAGPVFRGEESTFSRYMSSTTPDGVTGGVPKNVAKCPY